MREMRALNRPEKLAGPSSFFIEIGTLCAESVLTMLRSWISPTGER
jgi:hypothetical protein